MTTPSFAPPTTPLDQVTVVIILLLMICGIHFNLLVLYLFGKRRHYRLPSRLQLFCLAVDDMGTALLVEPLVVAMFYRGDVFERSDLLCRIFSNLLHIFPWGSIISLIVLSFTRVVIVIYPLAYKVWVTRQRIVHVIIAKYVFITMFLVISNPLWNFFFIPNIQSCFVSYDHVIAGDKVVPHINVIPYIVLLGSVIIVLLSAVVMGQILRQNFCSITARRVQSQNRAQMPSIARELMILVVIFILTNISIPLLALKNYLPWNLSENSEIMFAQVAKILFYAGPVANPVIYALRREDYRSNLHASINLTIKAKRLARQTLIAEAGLHLVVCTKEHGPAAATGVRSSSHLPVVRGLMRKCPSVTYLPGVRHSAPDRRFLTRARSASLDISNGFMSAVLRKEKSMVFTNTSAM